MSRITPEAPPHKKCREGGFLLALFDLLEPCAIQQIMGFFSDGLCRESIEIFLIYCGDLLLNCHLPEEQRIQQRIPLAFFWYGRQS